MYRRNKSALIIVYKTDMCKSVAIKQTEWLECGRALQNTEGFIGGTRGLVSRVANNFHRQ